MLSWCSSGKVGQFSERFNKNGGPVHHKGWFMSSDRSRPRDAQWTGLSSVGTWFHIDGEVRFLIWLVQFAMNVAQRWGDDWIQTNAEVESVHVCNWLIEIRSWYVMTTKWRSFAAKTAPHSSSCGMVTRFSGATFDFPVISWHCTVVAVEIRRYTAAAYPFSELSANAWSWILVGESTVRRRGIERVLIRWISDW